MGKKRSYVTLDLLHWLKELGNLGFSSLVTVLGAFPFMAAGRPADDCSQEQFKLFINLLNVFLSITSQLLSWEQPLWQSEPQSADVPWCGGSTWESRESIPALSLGAEVASRQEVDLPWIREFLNWLRRNSALTCNVHMEITGRGLCRGILKVGQCVGAETEKWVMSL